LKNLVIFLNELSFVSDEPVSPDGILTAVLMTLAAAKAAKRIRNDLIVAGSVHISGALLVDGTRSLAAILRDNHRDGWRFLHSLDQSSPWDAYPGTTTPGKFQEIQFQGKVAVGMLWAKQNESSILNFAFHSDWNDSHVSAHFREMDEEEEITSADCEIPNLSNPKHVAIHSALIANFGHAMSPSSVIYEGQGFIVRMFFNDHPPPHFHVFVPNISETQARYAVGTLDVLSGRLSSALHQRVREWAAGRRARLIQCWDRCRVGQHPFLLEDE
jgi:Domain of unknown function (DUF4160)